MIDKGIIDSIQAAIAGKTSIPASLGAAKVAAMVNAGNNAVLADGASKALATTGAATKGAVTKGAATKAMVGAPPKSLLTKFMCTTKALLLSPAFGGVVALGAVIGFEFWRGKVDEKKMNLSS